MSKKPNQAAIGAFVLGAVALAILGIVFFGSGKFFKKTNRAVMYFEGSIAGLDVGAPVEFRGVRVGRVSSTSLVYDYESASFRIPVYVELEEGRVRVSGVGESWQNPELEDLVKRGLRARLVNAGLITGKMKISLDFYPDTPIEVVGADLSVVEIPTVPGMMQAFLKKLQELPLDEIVMQAEDVLKGAAALINSPETRAFVENANAAIVETRDLVNRVNGKVEKIDVEEVSLQLRDALDAVEKLSNAISDEVHPTSISFRKAATEMTVALQQAVETLAGIETTLSADSPLHYEVGKMMEDIADAAKSMEIFLDQLQQDPSSLIWGKSSK